MNAYMERDDWSQRKTPQGFVSTVTFRKDNPVFYGHYPQNPIYPASLLIDFCYQQLCEYSGVRTPLDLDLCVSRASVNKGIRPGEIITFYFTTSDASQNLKKSVFVLQDAENNQIAKFEFSNITKRNLRAKSAINPHGKDLVPSYKYLPQRYPLLVIDNIAKENGTTGYANKLVSYGDFAFRKALSAETNEASLFYPFGAIIEGIEQSAALVLSNLWAVSDKEYEISIAGFSNIELHSHVSPGETLQFQSELEYQSDMHAIFSGIASVNNRITVSISKVFVVIKPLVRND